MDIAEMIEEFQSRGVALWANGDRLGYRSPKGVLTREDLAALKARKEEVLAHLRERDAIGHDEQARFEPFPMTDIQRAYATGQYSGYELGGTGCHSYAELLDSAAGPRALGGRLARADPPSRHALGRGDPSGLPARRPLRGGAGAGGDRPAGPRSAHPR